MLAAPRLPLPELLTEYSLHVDRKDLYVEGQEDFAVLHWFLGSDMDNGIGLYSIDAIEISAEQLIECGLNDSQKARLVFLARELDRALPKDENPALCIVDADFDYVLDQVEENRFLAYTDGTSLDMYAFNESTVERVVRLGLRDTNTDPHNVISSLGDVLTEVFFTRATNESMGLGLEWLPFEKKCKVEPNGTILFDREQFVREYLGKNNAMRKLSDFKRRKVELTDRSEFPVRRMIRGHDFGELLTKYLRSTIKTKLARNVAKGEAVVRMLFVGLDLNSLENEPLFRRIRCFVSGS